MKIVFNIDYWTTWGENIYLCGSKPEMGGWDTDRAIPLNFSSPSKWTTTIEIDGNEPFEYFYILKTGNAVIRKEWGHPRLISILNKDEIILYDLWHDRPQQQFLFSSAFTDSFFPHKQQEENRSDYEYTIRIMVNCQYAGQNEELVLCGETEFTGNWNPENAPRLQFIGNGKWQIDIDASSVMNGIKYKPVIYNVKTKNISYWETGNNRILYPLEYIPGKKTLRIDEINFNHEPINWKASGVAIPVFSLRSEKSYGTGEFSDLMGMIDWAAATGQKIIQILPINDTTIMHTWQDSYPYNAISIYALHPIYLGLSQFPLKNQHLQNEYQKQGKQLNGLKDLDYEKVIGLKEEYFQHLFDERGAETFNSNEYKEFFETNHEWLFPYACFCFLRDKFKTPDFTHWNGFDLFDTGKLKKLLEADSNAKRSVEISCFIQYLLHKQLSEIKAYAHSKGIILKGDIPIGISRYSVEAWVEPHLFNMDTQTGAPPDDFSINGQNWGFPTYNWKEMAKDGYQWWIKRFRKMADYFDAYRIDHILGFFRIWEIPAHSVEGLLGYFNPALPFTTEEINSSGFEFDEQTMTTPYIHENYLHQVFGEYTEEVKRNYLTPEESEKYKMNDFCNTQLKIKGIFDGQTDEKSNKIKNGLYALCNEVLFIRDKYETDKFHPRIAAQGSFVYLQMNETEKTAFNRLYDNFFYYRHNEFWKENALQKLPELISSTHMLVCGEDLGMIPQSVPDVMNQLQILSLEIQRMPKKYGVLFEDLDTIPYLSVCTTSTHDMSPIRLWWTESRPITQRFYNEILQLPGEAPEECTPEICSKIISEHINSAAMLVILPLQDWLSTDAIIREPDPAAERINIPANPRNYWKYRMHITLEELLNSEGLNNHIYRIIKDANR